MAQAGGFCPAESVKIGICDKLFCRVGSGDELAKGNSTFMVEMLETARILQKATNRSLVILDEIGRGTSTYDGMSIAWATIEYLIEKVKNSGGRIGVFPISENSWIDTGYLRDIN